MPVSKPAAVIGAGPNGLAAAVTLARAGVPVTVFEAAETVGGGTRTAETVRPGVLHDVCSAIHPMALASEFFTRFELSKRMKFVVPEASYAHPLDGAAGSTNCAVGSAAVAYRDLARTAAELGDDGAAYTRLYAPLLRRLSGLLDAALGSTLLRLPADPIVALAAARRIVEQGTPLWNLRFRTEAAAALVCGVAAHRIGGMPHPASAGVCLLLGALGHASGWPVPVGGSRAITEALAADLTAHGGTILVEHAVTDARELHDYGVKIFDTSARGLARIAGDLLPQRYRRALERFSYGAGATKIDFVLDGPIPWQDARITQAPTVHVGGSRGELVAAEREVSLGRHPQRPYVLLAQPTQFDGSRTPDGVHAIWSYTHVPHGSDADMRARVTAQIERFAPGFRDRIIAVKQTTAAALSRYNRNYHGGDFGAGAVTLRQLLARPTLSRNPHRTPTPGIYLASSSTAPGPGVHGLSGWYAARSALRYDYQLPEPQLGITATSGQHTH